MTKTVYVTPGQKAAAEVAVRRSEATGRPVSTSVQKIAAAKPRKPQKPPKQSPKG